MPKVSRSTTNLDKLYITPRMYLYNKIALYSQIPNYYIGPMDSPTQLLGVILRLICVFILISVI